MATLESLGLDLSAQDASSRPIYRRLGLLNGLIIGLALAAGAWGLETLRVIQLPFRLYLPTLVLGMVFVTVVSTLTGWLTSRFAKPWFTIPLWLVTAAIAILTMGYLGYYGRSLVVWLADRQFWGRNIYPYTLSSSVSGLLLGGFLIFLVIGMLALLQSYRLENMVGNLGGKSRINVRTWLGLLLPVPFVFAAAFLTKSSMFDPAALAANVTNDAIQVARTYEGDLTQLGKTAGINYGALRGVRDQLGGDYMLSLAEINPSNTSVTIAADFAGGSWIYCRLVADQLSHCYDASPPYMTGLQSLLAGQPIAEDCRGCLPRFEDETMPAQLAEVGRSLGGSPTIERVAQWGSHVLMRATGPNGNALDCWYEGITRTYLTGCTPATSD
jgi:hypothetical protein